MAFRYWRTGVRVVHGPGRVMVQGPMVSPATGFFPDVFLQLPNRETHGPELGFLGSNSTGV